MKKRSRFTIKTKEMIIEPIDESNIWEGEWVISIITDKVKEIGRATFAGEKALGTIPIRVDINEEYQCQGYGKQAFKLLVEFAFGYKNIYEVEAYTLSDNDKCINALEKAGFVRRKKEGKNETYSVIKPNTVWLGLYIYIGLIAGILIGIVINIMWAGLVIGLVIGIMLGAIMDSGAKKEREKITGRKDG